ncbi:MAG: hypothetical protein E6I64_11045 [Chloroflexi bacterium]|nr:MAG: hypothetical protein E6I64_11045 [Chloroflexota bacterium]
MTVLVGVALVSGLTTYGALAARFPRSSQSAFASPSPAQTASPTATATPSPSPTPSPTPAPDLTVTVKKIDVPAEFRYLIVGNAPELRLIVLDLDAKTANDVGTIHVPTTPGVQFPSISPSADGKSLLISVYLAAGGATVYLVHPDRGESQALIRGSVVSAVISPDATRFAIGRNDADQTMTGCVAARVRSRRGRHWRSGRGRVGELAGAAGRSFGERSAGDRRGRCAPERGERRRVPDRQGALRVVVAVCVRRRDRNLRL